MPDTNPNPNPNPNPPATPTWTDGMAADQIAFIQNKGYKGPADLLSSYQNLEKLHGVPQDRIIKLPESMDTPEGRAVFERLGLPKDAKDYDLKARDGEDPKAVEQYAAALHEAGITKSAAQKITAKLQEQSDARVAAAKEAAQLQFANSEANLKKEWGQAFEQNTNLAKEAARVLGVNDKQVNALAAQLGHDGAMKLFHKLSTAVREADFVGGKPPSNGIMAPEQARAEIKNLMADRDFGQRLTAGDREARAKWDNLHKMAYDGQQGF